MAGGEDSVTPESFCSAGTAVEPRSISKSSRAIPTGGGTGFSMAEDEFNPDSDIEEGAGDTSECTRDTLAGLAEAEKVPTCLC